MTAGQTDCPNRLAPAAARYLKLFFVSGMVSAPAKKSTEIPNKKIANMFGRSAGAGENNETKVGIIPPIANPMFHDSPVPVERSAVGKRSLRKTTSGA
jgi:hypothetical protein